MKFQYIGPDKDAPKTVEVFGYEFRLNGNYVDVTDNHAIQKLSGNKCFQVKAGEEIADAEFEEMQDPKSELIEQCLAKGIEVDKRWGIDRLKAALGAE